MQIQRKPDKTSKQLHSQTIVFLVCFIINIFQICLSKTLRYSLNMEKKIIPSLPVSDRTGRLSTHYLYELKFTAVRYSMSISNCC